MSITGGPGTNYNIHANLIKADIAKVDAKEARAGAAATGTSSTKAKEELPTEEGVLSDKARAELARQAEIQKDIDTVGDDAQEIAERADDMAGEIDDLQEEEDEKDLKAHRYREAEKEAKLKTVTITGSEGTPLKVTPQEAKHLEELDSEDNTISLYEGHGRPLKDHEIKAAENYLVQTGIIDKAEKGEPIDLVSNKEVDQVASKMELDLAPDPEAKAPLLEPHDTNNKPISLELPAETEQIAKEAAAARLQAGETDEAMIVGLESSTAAQSTQQATSTKEGSGSTPVRDLVLTSFREREQSLRDEMGELFAKLPETDKQLLKPTLKEVADRTPDEHLRALGYASIITPYALGKMEEVADREGRTIQTPEQMMQFARENSDYAHYGLLAGTAALLSQADRLSAGLSSLNSQEQAEIDRLTQKNLAEFQKSNPHIPPDKIDRSLIAAHTIKEYAGEKALKTSPSKGFKSVQEEQAFRQAHPEYDKYCQLYSDASQYLDMSSSLAEGKSQTKTGSHRATASDPTSTASAHASSQAKTGTSSKAKVGPAGTTASGTTAYTGEAKKLMGIMDQEFSRLPEADRRELSENIDKALKQAGPGSDENKIKAEQVEKFCFSRLQKALDIDPDGKQAANKSTWDNIKSGVKRGIARGLHQDLLDSYTRMGRAAHAYLEVRQEEAADLAHPVDPKTAQGGDLLRPSVLQHYGTRLAAYMRGAGVQGMSPGPAQQPPSNIHIQQDPQTGNVVIQNTSNGASWNLLPPQGVEAMANNPVEYRNWVNTLPPEQQQTVLQGLDSIRAVLDGTPTGTSTGANYTPNLNVQSYGGYPPGVNPQIPSQQIFGTGNTVGPQQPGGPSPYSNAAMQPPPPPYGAYSAPTGGIPPWAQQQYQAPPMGMTGWENMGYYNPAMDQKMTKSMMMMAMLSNLAPMMMMLPMLTMSMMPFPMGFFPMMMF